MRGKRRHVEFGVAGMEVGSEKVRGAHQAPVRRSARRIEALPSGSWAKFHTCYRDIPSDDTLSNRAFDNGRLYPLSLLFTSFVLYALQARS